MSDFLSVDDKRNWEEKLGKQYVLKQQIGVGERTVAYKMLKCDTKEKYVLLFSKVPLSSERKQKFKTFFESVKKRQSFCAEGYKGNIFIPEFQLFEDFRIQKYAGEALSQELYNRLSLRQKEKIAEDIAEYLLFVHEKSLNNADNDLFDSEKVKIGQIVADNFWSPEDMYQDIKFWDKYLSCEDKNKIEKYISDYENRDKSDEIAVLTHGDLRYQNILYDCTKERLAIIDYELCHVSSLYKDLCPFCHTGLDWDLTRKIADIYNQKASKTWFDIEKVKLFSIISFLAECSRCSRFRPQMAKKLWNEFKQNEERICNG